MDSLFNKNTADHFIDRIYQLSPGTQPQWGKMNAAQMLTHCQIPLDIASGKLQPTIHPIIKFLFGKRAKRELIEEHEFKRHLPTFREARIYEHRDFEKERERLLILIRGFQEAGPEHLTKDPHPFFGKMSVEEWNILQVKHLDHHLRQFGV